jgi:RNase P protein component
MFSLKYPSLLQFDQGTRQDDPVRHNLRTLYGVSEAPCDTQMRSILDPVEPRRLRPAFRALHSALQRGNALKDYAYLEDAYLLSIDGTGVFSSSRVSCPHCCEKNTKHGPEYYHQLLAAVIVHPARRTVLPVDFEPITRADGAKKNDCERNAAKRLLASVAAQYPKRRFIVVEDALAANGPHLQALQQHQMDFIIVAKPGGNSTLFETVQQRLQQGLCTEWEEVDESTGDTRGYRFSEHVPLNQTHPDLAVNFLEYWEVDAKGQERVWSWITNLAVSRDNAEALMRAGRARWKIENETFNTLKNQGYHFEHNFGHGKQYLCSTLAGLMLLAFLIDQIQEHACRVFQRARERYQSRRYLWEKFRALFLMAYAPNWEALMSAWADPGRHPHTLLAPDTS